MWIWSAEILTLSTFAFLNMLQLCFFLPLQTSLVGIRLSANSLTGVWGGIFVSQTFPFATYVRCQSSGGFVVDWVCEWTRQRNWKSKAEHFYRLLSPRCMWGTFASLGTVPLSGPRGSLDWKMVAFFQLLYCLSKPWNSIYSYHTCEIEVVSKEFTRSGNSLCGTPNKSTD